MIHGKKVQEISYENGEYSPCVILNLELTEFPDSCKHFPSEIMCSISKTGISSFHSGLNFSLLLTSQHHRNDTRQHCTIRRHSM